MIVIENGARSVGNEIPVTVSVPRRWVGCGSSPSRVAISPKRASVRSATDRAVSAGLAILAAAAQRRAGITDLRGGRFSVGTRSCCGRSPRPRYPAPRRDGRRRAGRLRVGHHLARWLARAEGRAWRCELHGTSWAGPDALQGKARSSRSTTPPGRSRHRRSFHEGRCGCDRIRERGPRSGDRGDGPPR